MSRRPSARLLRALAAGLLALTATAALTAAGVLDGFEHTLLDKRYEVRGTQLATDVVVVGIDEDTVAALDFPFRRGRGLHARAIDTLLAAGARAIAYDVQFSTPSPLPGGDRRLLAAAADRRVVLGTAEIFEDGLPALIGARQLLARGGRIGSVLLPVDSDGVWRRMLASAQGLPTLATLAADGDPGAGEHPIDFAGPPGTVDEISFLDVLDRRFERARVRGKVVVVGATALAQQDVHPTAAGHGPMPGPEIHANAIQTVLDGYPLDDAPAGVAGLLVVLAALLAPLATLRGTPERAMGWALGAGAAGVAALLGGGQLAFEQGLILPLAAPLLAVVLGTAGAIALTYDGELRARRRLRTTFERFVPSEVAAELLARDGGGATRLESRRLEATVLFCDLRGFTTLAERLEAEQVIAVLNRYLELVSGAVFGHGGTVVSYQGDGVMAVFGAPLAQADHAARAFAAARRLLDTELPRFNDWMREQGLADAELEAGIGLNSGPVMSGIVGSERRAEYAAVGDATNVAARLQALGRDVDGRLFVSGTTYAALDGAAAAGLRLHGEVELRGRREPVTVYVGK